MRLPGQTTKILSFKSAFFSIWLVHFFALCAHGHAWASSPQALLSHVFQTPSGRSTYLSQELAQAKGKRALIVVFWAGWCVPCKAELALLAQSPELLKNIAVAAVSIDESSEWPLASATLGSLGWPYLDLRDTSGAFFYELNPKGDLPYAILFDDKGQVLQVMRKLDKGDIDAMSARFSEPVAAGAPNVTPSVAAGVSLSVTDEWRSGRGLGADSNRAGIANSLSIGGQQSWPEGVRVEALATHDLLRQKRAQANWDRTEDDLGKSFLQVTFPARFAPETIASLRLGDDHVEWASGLLLSIKPSPLLPNVSALQGVHAGVVGPRVSLFATAGRVREMLFPSRLDLDKDLSRTLPEDRIAGAVLKGHLEPAAGLEISGGLGLVRSLRLKNEARGVPYDLGAHRFAIFAGAKSKRTESEMQWVRTVRSGTGKQGTAANVTAGVRLLEGGSAEAVTLSLGANTRNNLPAFSSVPELIDSLGVPLDAQNKQAGRVQIRWDGAPFASVLQSGVTHEGSTHQVTSDTKWHGYANWTLPHAQSKAALYGSQAKLQTTASTEREGALQVAFPLLKALTTQVTLRTQKIQAGAGSANLPSGARASVQTRGTQSKVNLDLNLSEAGLIDPTTWGKLSLQGSHVWQIGSYRATSGLDKAQLQALFVAFSRNQFSLRAGGGQEPGGIVCTDGTCALRAPLNGLLLEARAAVYF